MKEFFVLLWIDVRKAHHIYSISYISYRLQSATSLNVLTQCASSVVGEVSLWVLEPYGPGMDMVNNVVVDAVHSKMLPWVTFRDIIYTNCDLIGPVRSVWVMEHLEEIDHLCFTKML